MSAVATAVVGTALVTGYMGSQAAKSAAKASAKGADAASQVQWDMYDQSRKDQMPWLGTGQNALKQLAALNGVQYAEGTEPAGAQTQDNFDAQAYIAANGPEVGRYGGKSRGHTPEERAWAHYMEHGKNEGRPFAYINAPSEANNAGGSTTPDYSAFYNSPDYQFTFGEGQRAVNSGLAARGLSNSGRAMKELTRYGQGAASTQLNTYRNALAAMAGVGQQTASNVGTQGMQTGQIVGQNTQSAADARASGYLGSANSWNSAINGAAGLGAYGKTNKWWG